MQKRFLHAEANRWHNLYSCCRSAAASESKGVKCNHNTKVTLIILVGFHSPVNHHTIHLQWFVWSCRICICFLFHFENHEKVCVVRRIASCAISTTSNAIMFSSAMLWMSNKIMVPISFVYWLPLQKKKMTTFSSLLAAAQQKDSSPPSEFGGLFMLFHRKL